MAESEKEKLVKKQILNEADLAEIQALTALCNEYEGLNLKINWELLRAREPGQTSDFCYYRDGELIGYLALDGSGADFELTGMVQPAFRRQGIFRRLFAEVLLEAKRRGTTELLLVCENASVAGTAFARASATQYSFSEYHMELEAINVAAAPGFDLEFQLATSDDANLLTRLQALSFDQSEEAAHAHTIRDLTEDTSRTYIVRLKGAPIGKFGTVLEDNGVYIRGVGVVPDYRGRGYGRQILTWAIHQMIAEGHTHLSLDVATENRNALSLYQSCGFHETNVYDYYDVPL